MSGHANGPRCEIDPFGRLPVHAWLDEIYREHRQGLFSLALSVTRQPMSAEDAVHDAIVRLAKSNATPEGNAVAYVFRSVRNAAIDQLRKRGRSRETPLEHAASLFASTSPAPEAQMMTTESNAQLMQAVDALPEAQRQAIVMKIFAGLTFQQIAQACDEPISTVASRYQRGLAKLKHTMEGQHEPATV